MSLIVLSVAWCIWKCGERDDAEILAFFGVCGMLIEALVLSVYLYSHLLGG